jgi:hypothetical protein
MRCIHDPRCFLLLQGPRNLPRLRRARSSSRARSVHGCRARRVSVCCGRACRLGVLRLDLLDRPGAALDVVQRAVGRAVLSRAHVRACRLVTRHRSGGLGTLARREAVRSVSGRRADSRAVHFLSFSDALATLLASGHAQDGCSCHHDHYAEKAMIHVRPPSQAPCLAHVRSPTASISKPPWQ